MVDKLNIAFEDSEILAINKTAGMLSIPDRYDPEKLNVYSLLKQDYPEIYIVHRIDKDTSGLLLFAKNERSHKALNELFENQLVDKNYLCFAESCPSESEGLIDLPIAHSPFETSKMMVHPKGKPSQTKFKILDHFGSFCHLLVKPLTGRTHQIRVHLAYIGCPLICDPLYGSRTEISILDIKKRAVYSKDQEIRPILQRTALHSWALNFKLQGNPYELKSEIPKDLKALLNQLKKWR